MVTTTKNYTDIDISFLPHPITGDVLLKKDVNSIVQSVMNLVQINHYEKPFHPEIGSGIRQLLFELADPVTATQIANEIKVVIANFEPRVRIINVYVNSTPDGDGYNATLEFSIVGLSTPITISVFLERIR